jgi:hypothetical protein
MSNNSSDDNGKPQTTDTDMYISILANSEKLRPKQDLYHYVDDIRNDSEEKIESCMDENEVDIHDSNTRANIPDDYAQNDIPLQSNQPSAPPDTNLGNQIKLTSAEDVDEYDTATPVRKKLLKLNMIRKLTELVSKGVKLSQNYNMDSDYKTMKYECELHNSIREKHNTVLFLQDGCVTTVGALEKANKRFGSFGLELDGWSDSVNSKTDQLYDVFGDLYEKWSGPGRSIPPEISLLGILGFSAAKTHWVNSSASSVPSLENKRREDPNYIEKIRQQALGHTVIDQEKKQGVVFTEKLTKQYNNAMEQALDYKKLREHEEEYNKINSQQQIRPPSFPSSLMSSQTHQMAQNQQPPMQQPQMRQQPLMQQQQTMMMQNMIPTGMTDTQFKKFREAEIRDQRERFERELEKRSSTRNGSGFSQGGDEVSQDSIVQMNPDIDDILREAESASNMSKSGKRKPRKNAKKSNNSIRLDM